MSNRRDVLSYIGVGAIGGMLGYYTGAQELLGIQASTPREPTSQDTSTPVDSTPPEENEPPESEISDSINAQNGLAYNDGRIYFEDDGQIHQYDRSSGDIVTSFSYPTEGRNWPRGLAYGNDSLWFADVIGPSYDGAVAELDPTTGEELSRISMSWDPVGLGFGEGSLWVVDITSNTIREYSPSGEEQSSFSYSQPTGTTWGRGLTYYNGSLWLGNFCDSDGCTVSLFEFSTAGELLQETGQRTGDPPMGYGGLATAEDQLLGTNKDGNVSVLRSLEE